MTPRQEQILSILESHPEPLTREQIVAYLPGGLRCHVRDIQPDIIAIERERRIPIINIGGYKIADCPELLDKYEHSVLTMYSHAQAEREHADLRYNILQESLGKVQRESRTAQQYPIIF